MREIPTPTFDLSPIALPRGLLHRPLQPYSFQNHQILAPAVRGNIEVSWAKHQDEVRETQRLRFDVFATEMGARLQTTKAGHDIDAFDNYCEHLLVRDVETRWVPCCTTASLAVTQRRVSGDKSNKSIWHPLSIM